MTVNFPDVSHHQAGLKLKGAQAVIMKASQGSSYRDTSFNDFRNQAIALRIPWAAYHWVDTTDLAAQAKNIFGAAGTAPVMWDAEASGSTVPRLVELTTRLRDLGGNPTLVYLPHWFWEGTLHSPSLTPLVNLGLSLISSNYSGVPGAGWVPYGGMKPTIWQYTDHQAFNGMHIDFNTYPGTVDQLAAVFCGQEEVDDMAKSIVLIREADGVNAGWVWVCNGPVRYHVPSPEALNEILTAYGMTTADIRSVPAAMVPAAYGTDAAGLVAASDALAILVGLANEQPSAPVHDKDGVQDLTRWPGLVADAAAGSNPGAVPPHTHVPGAVTPTK